MAAPRPPRAAEVRARLEPFAAYVPPASGEPQGVLPDAPSRSAAAEGATRWPLGWRGPEGDRTLVGVEPAAFRDMPMVVVISSLSDEAKRRTFDASLGALPRDGSSTPKTRSRRSCGSCGSRRSPVRTRSRSTTTSRAGCSPREHVRAVGSWETPPPATELYVIHAVHPDARRGRWWLHTHGLQRAGLPDVEVVGVPPCLAQAGGDLVNAFVRANLGRSLPIRGSSSRLFLDHPVAWVPVAEAVASLGPLDAGLPKDRGGPGSHDGRRIALVAPGDRGGVRRAPVALLRAHRAGRTCVSVPDAESQRCGRLARERWPVFARLFAEHGRDAEWLFKTCLAIPAGDDFEFLWWTVEHVAPDGFRARLETRPLAARGHAPGDVAWHPLERVGDWVVHGPTRSFHPGTV